MTAADATTCPGCRVNGRCQCTRPCGHPDCEAAAEERWMTENYPAAMSTAGAPEFEGAVKPFCPCDAGRPQDCKPEEWPGAHAHSDCTRCGRPSYQHRGLRYCPAIPKGSAP